MPRYHVSPKTQNVLVCRASPGRCWYRRPDGSEAPHYTSAEEGQKAVEKVLTEAFGSVRSYRSDKGSDDRSDPVEYLRGLLDGADDGTDGEAVDETDDEAGRKTCPRCGHILIDADENYYNTGKFCNGRVSDRENPYSVEMFNDHRLMPLCDGQITEASMDI